MQFVAADGSHGQRIILEGEEVTDVIRTEQVGAGASQGRRLTSRARCGAAAPAGVPRNAGVGGRRRDMGTVVFPDAPLKIFLTASAEERARRRYLQLKAKGADVDQSALLEEIRERDGDSQRAVAPLKPADDAILLDSTRNEHRGGGRDDHPALRAAGLESPASFSAELTMQGLVAEYQTLCCGVLQVRWGLPLDLDGAIAEQPKLGIPIQECNQKLAGKPANAAASI